MREILSKEVIRLPEKSIERLRRLNDPIVSIEVTRLPGIPRERLERAMLGRLRRRREKLMDLYDNGTKSEIDAHLQFIVDNLESMIFLSSDATREQAKDALNSDIAIMEEKVKNAVDDEQLMKMKRGYNNAHYLYKVFELKRMELERTPI